MRSCPRARGTWAFAVLLFAASACGGGSGGVAPPSVDAPVTGTLAYVVNECREDARTEVTKQALHIRHGESGEVTVAEFQTPPLPALGLCPLYGQFRYGNAAAALGVFQRLGVSRDGSFVVFEVTDHFALFAADHIVPPEQDGIFVVRPDGSGLRRVAPASREAAFRFVPDVQQPSGFAAQFALFFDVGFDNRSLVYSDLGPGPAGVDAVQIFLLDLITGERRQLTRFPAVEEGPADIHTCCPFFLDPATIGFSISPFADPTGFKAFQLTLDGTIHEIPQPVAYPGSHIVPTFEIAGGLRSRAPVFTVPGTPANHVDGLPDRIQEVFLVDRDHLLQLTNLHRVDTIGGPLSSDGRVLFAASADPFGTNPTETCQIFSIETTGTGLRQVTSFDPGVHSDSGCNPGPPPGCFFYDGVIDANRTVGLFASACDPFGPNPNANQVLAMRSDGSGLRRLTQMRGMTTDADGTVNVQLLGPFAYGPQ